MIVGAIVGPIIGPITRAVVRGLDGPIIGPITRAIIGGLYGPIIGPIFAPSIKRPVTGVIIGRVERPFVIEGRFEGSIIGRPLGLLGGSGAMAE